MSRIGNKAIGIPEGVRVQFNPENILSVKGEKGELSFKVSKKISISIEDKSIKVTRSDDTKNSKSLHGLTRSIINNMVEGIKKEWEKTLEVIGVGYRVQLANDLLKLSLGFSHVIEFKLPNGIKAEIIDNNKIKILGIDKQQVGQVAANIRKLKQPDSYKGKGIRYLNEQIILKEGKSAKK